MNVKKNYVDSHGQSEVAFAFCHLLGFQLLPRLKPISRQRLYLPLKETADDLAHLEPVLTRPIRWHLIEQQYDEMVKFATALRLGTAETEAILRRFTRKGPQHPTYKALAELGKAVKTIFLHLLQVCMVYINTLMSQQILSEPDWQNRLEPEDLRALTPLIYAHVNPYGRFGVWGATVGKFTVSLT
jgi:TnpA family transposase